MFRFAYILLTICGILYCPYQCMGSGCAGAIGDRAEAPKLVSACICCDHGSRCAVPATDELSGRSEDGPGSSECCSCLCKTSYNQSPKNPLDLDWLAQSDALTDLLQADQSPLTMAERSLVRYVRPLSAGLPDGRGIRILMSSLLL